MNLLDGIPNNSFDQLLGVRPEKLKIGRAKESTDLELEGILDMVEETGDSRVLHLKTSYGVALSACMSGQFQFRYAINSVCAANTDLYHFPKT